MKAFLEYLEKISPLTNWAALEQLAGMPARTMYKHFSGHQQLPDKHIPSILQVLCQTMGAVKIGDTEYRFDSGTFYWQKPIKEAKIKRAGTDFEYLETQARGVCDALDILQIFE